MSPTDLFERASKFFESLRKQGEVIVDKNMNRKAGMKGDIHRADRYAMTFWPALDATPDFFTFQPPNCTVEIMVTKERVIPPNYSMPVDSFLKQYGF